MSEAVPTPTPTPEPTPTPTPDPTPTPTPAATWRDGLPDDIKGDATLGRYADTEALARAHIEAHKTAKSKNSIPAADAPPEDWGKFYDTLGRPKTADEYELPMPELSVPEGATEADKTAAAEALKAEYAPFRALAHEHGLTAKQAAAVAQYDLDRTKAFLAKGEEEIAALKGEMGEGVYQAKLEVAKKVFTMLGFPEQFADELDRKVGSAALVKGFMRLADISGEQPVIRGGGGEVGKGLENAQAQLSAKYADKSWREKYQAKDASTIAEHDRLLAAAKDQAFQ